MDILIVDDEPYIQRSLSFVLKKEGYEVETASNGKEGLEKALMLKPRLIFLDVMMPELNGFNACKAIKSEDSLKESYVIFLTGKGQEVDRELGLQVGADEFLSKPFSPMEIVEKVKGILGDSKR